MNHTAACSIQPYIDQGTGRVELTLSPKLQAHVQEVFARYAVPAGAFDPFKVEITSA